MFFSKLYTNIFSVIVIFQAFIFVCPQFVQSQSLRSTFPGRRVGGGTRGECASRLIMHLVPKSSQYSISSEGQVLIGLVQGPSDSPTGLDLIFRPLSSNSIGEHLQQKSVRHSFEPRDASLIILSPGLNKSQSYNWESSFNCQQSTDFGEFDFITSGSPPALSLLTIKPDEFNDGISKTLYDWKNSCGGSIPTLDVLKKFEFTDLLSSDWPARLPIYCP